FTGNFNVGDFLKGQYLRVELHGTIHVRNSDPNGIDGSNERFPRLCEQRPRRNDNPEDEQRSQRGDGRSSSKSSRHGSLNFAAMPSPAEELSPPSRLPGAATSDLQPAVHLP